MSRGNVGPIDNTDMIKVIDDKIKNAGGVVVSDTAPSNKNCMWVNSTGVMRYYDKTTGTWKVPKSVFV